MVSYASKPLTFAIVVGEASGDLLGAGLIQALRQHYPTSRFIGIPGPQMVTQGCECLFPAERLAVMGLVEVVRRLPEIWRIRSHLLQYLQYTVKPDIYIGIDAPDFNLGVAKRLHKIGIPTVHYTSPSIWAWKAKRIDKIADSIDLMLTLFPFEKPYYQARGIPVEFVGHPLTKILQPQPASQARHKLGLPETSPILALLPGSRESELMHNTLTFLRAAKWCKEKRPDLLLVAGMVNEARKQQFEQILQQHAPDLAIQVFLGQTHTVMQAADAILLASGTATLEACLLQKPMVVAHRLASLTYWIAKHLVNLEYIALPNILAGQKQVPEFIQEDAQPESIGQALLAYFDDPAAKANLNEHYQMIRQQLSKDSDQLAAKAILNLLTGQGVI